MQKIHLFLANLNHWHWGILAVGLTLLELALPRSIFLWLGMAAGIVSGLLFLFPGMGWVLEVVLFLLIVLVSVGLFRTVLPRPVARRTRPLAASHLPALSHRASQYVGRLFVLSHPIQNGVGVLHINNVAWTVYGLDMAAGTRVKVVGFEGAVLAVESLEQGATDPVE
ncbi:MAG: NfeD family protein [Magnetococcus sp. YQC-3]